MSVPTYVLVHGAWHGAWSWKSLTAEFDRRTVPWLALDLPSSHDEQDGSSDLQTDVAAVVAVAQSVGPVVLVGHSYGGAVVAEAAGRLAEVSAVVFVAAIIPTVGQCVTDVSRLVPGRTALDEAISVDGPWLRLDPLRAMDALYGDCDPAAAEQAVHQLRAQTIASFRAQRTTPDGSASRRYIRCTGDRAVHPSLQTLMAATCDATVDLVSDHSPFLSHPKACADAILSW